MPSLAELGWKPVFQQQLAAGAPEATVPARVFEVQRSGLIAVGERGSYDLSLGGRWYRKPEIDRPTVGDWVLLNESGDDVVELLERISLLARVSPGADRGLQLIAANLDTAFIVTSCNDEFNEARLERYLSLLWEAGISPVVVLTKRDLIDDAHVYGDRVRSLDAALPVELVDATNPDTISGVRAWCGSGQTVAMLGSSGVGKSTLVNALLGEQRQVTRSIRADDAKGRHTTSHRSLHLIPGGGLVLDNPGIRELQVADVESGLEQTFADIESLVDACQFRDCQHVSEPGCAVALAVEEGRLDERRLISYQKLLREQRHNSESLAERHARMRAFSKRVRNAYKKKQQLENRD